MAPKPNYNGLLLLFGCFLSAPSVSRGASKLLFQVGQPSAMRSGADSLFNDLIWIRHVEMRGEQFLLVQQRIRPELVTLVSVNWDTDEHSVVQVYNFRSRIMDIKVCLEFRALELFFFITSFFATKYTVTMFFSSYAQVDYRFLGGRASLLLFVVTQGAPDTIEIGVVEDKFSLRKIVSWKFAYALSDFALTHRPSGSDLIEVIGANPSGASVSFIVNAATAQVTAGSIADGKPAQRVTAADFELARLSLIASWKSESSTVDIILQRHGNCLRFRIVTCIRFRLLKN